MSCSNNCLICDEEIPESNGISAPNAKRGVPVFNETKLKFVLTSSQYSALQKVLSLPEGVCKNELSLGPYCKSCFTEINNVCHCLSALETLRQSIVEFRNGFGAKMKKTCDAATANRDGLGTRKRKVDEGSFSARFTILSCLKNTVFQSGIPEASQETAKILHDTISHMDPNGTPDTKVDKDQVVRVTNGAMPRRISPIIGQEMQSSSAKKKSPGKKTSKNKIVVKKKIQGGKKPVAKRKVVVTPVTTPQSGRERRGTTNLTTKEKDAQPYQCWCCSKKYSNEEALKHHEETAHRVPCTKCSKIFHTKKSLYGHNVKVHGVVRKQPATSTSHRKKKGGRKYPLKQCTQCPRGFPNYTSLYNHLAKVHGNVSLKNNTLETTTGTAVPSKNVSPTKVVNPKPKPRPGRCKVCLKIVMDVQHHMRQVHPESKPRSCSSSTIDEESLPIPRAKGSEDGEHQPNNNESIKGIPPPVVITPTTEDNKTEENVSMSEPEQDVKMTTLLGSSPFKTDNYPTPFSSLSPSPPRLKPFFQIPASLAKLPALSPQGQSSSPSSGGGGSKYQFKNLLKIGDK